MKVRTVLLLSLSLWLSVAWLVGSTPASAYTPLAEQRSKERGQFAATSPAQPQPNQGKPAGLWRSYTAASYLNAVAVEGNRIWAGATGGVVEWQADSGRFRKYTRTDGLAGNNVLAIAIDHAGHKWFGTSDGVSEFDGQHWTTYTTADGLAHNTTLAIAVDRQGELWFGAAGGISRFDGQRWTTYTTADGLTHNKVNALAVDAKGNLWAGAFNGLNQFDGQRWISHALPAELGSYEITALAIDQQGGLWVGNQAGVAQFDGSTWRFYRQAGDEVYAIAVDDAGALWVGGRKGVRQYTGQSWRSYSPSQALMTDEVRAIAVDPAGRKWFASWGGGLGELDGEVWRAYRTNDGPASNLVRAITIDQTGKLWFGADTPGCRLSAIGGLCLSQGGGVTSFDGRRWTTYTTADGLADNRAQQLVVDQAGHLWAGSSYGDLDSGTLSEFDGQRWISHSSGDSPANDGVQALAVDQEGALWIGAFGNGVSKFDGTRWTSYTTADGLADGDVRALAIDANGRVWAGTAEHGLSVFDGQDWTTYTTADGLVDNHITAIVVDLAGNLWVGSERSGVSKFDGARWTSYTVADGLVDDHIRAIALDPAGNLWFGAWLGVSRYDGHTWRSYTPADGLVAAPVNAIAIDANGHKWFGTSGGVSELDDSPSPRPSPRSPNHTPGKVLLPTPTPEPTPAAQPAAPRLAPPQQPLGAWSIAPDGALFVLDNVGRVYELSAADLTPLGRSAPILAGGGQAPAYLLAGEDRLFVGSEAISQTLVLDRAKLDPRDRIDQAGPMALDPGRQLLMIPRTLAGLRPYSGVLLIYDLADLSAPPRSIQTGCLSGALLAEPAGRLYLQERNCQSSPPHQGDFYRIYDLDSWGEVGEFRPDPFRGHLEGPAVAAQTGQAVAINHGLNGSHDLYLFDRDGGEIRSLKNTTAGHSPVIDAAGEWLYLLYPHGLAVLDADELALRSFLPFTQTSPSALALSPAGDRLYLLGNGWLAVRSTDGLQKLGVQPISPLPPAWLQDENAGDQVQTVRYPSPTFAQDGVLFLQVKHEATGLSEIYRSRDGGEAWQPLPVLSGADLDALSLSPTFAEDQTVVTAFRRSTDGGDTWQPWSSPLAFVSDRTGNRELFMADEYGAHLRRLTDHPADDENPAWSPAWTRVAFQSKRNGNWDLYSLRAECAPPRSECDLQPLTDHPADDLLPAWSPDGRRIAFVSLRDGNAEIYLMDQDGRNQRRLTFHSGGDWRPAWLPDSQHLVFTSDRSGNNDLYQLAVPATDAPPPTGEADLTTLVSSPADERDPAVGVSSMLANYFDQPELLFFLSDQAGGWKTFVTSLDGRALPVQPFAEFDQPQAHPSWLKGYTLLVAVGEGADSDIDALTPFGASSPLIVSPGFDGHPAGGPVWWQPVAESDQAPLSPP